MKQDPQAEEHPADPQASSRSRNLPAFDMRTYWKRYWRIIRTYAQHKEGREEVKVNLYIKK